MFNLSFRISSLKFDIFQVRVRVGGAFLIAFIDINVHSLHPSCCRPVTLKLVDVLADLAECLWFYEPL